MADTVSLCVFIHSPPVVTGKKFGVSELGTDVINYISHATQQRLQNLLEKASHVAQHKNITFKVIINYIKWNEWTKPIYMFSVLISLMHLSVLSCHVFNAQEDERYEQVSDVRTQLKFFEQLDQMEKQRKEEQEREILLKAAKVTIHEKHRQYHWQDKFYFRTA